MRPEILRACLAVTAFLGAAGCETPRAADPVEPPLGDPCRYTDCSDSGTCVPAEGGGPQCLCDVGYRGTDCSVCEADFHRNALDRCVPDKRCDELDEDPCGAHGTCVDQEGVIACDCDDGYEGPRCQLCDDRHEHDAEGRCLPLLLGTTGAALSCPRGYTGASCTLCEDGFHLTSDRCEPDEVCSGTSCPPNALCAVDAGAVSCSCLPQYTGVSCYACSAAHHRAGDECVADEVCEADSCPANATCRVETGTIACPCDPGHAGESCETCAQGYHRSADLCVPDEACDTGACPPHASCAVIGGEAECSCLPGYQGELCDACQAGFHASGGLCVLDEFCQSNSCPENTLCSVAGGLVQCTCDEGWGPPGECDVCEAYTTAWTGFEFPTGWATSPNQCNTRDDLTAAGMTFESRVTVDGAQGRVGLCARNDFARMSSQHIQLESYWQQPAVITLDHPTIVLSFEYAALLSPLNLDVRVQREPSTQSSTTGDYERLVDPNAPLLSTIQLPAERSGELTLYFDPTVRVISLFSRDGSLQKIAIDNISASYPLCD